MSEIKLTAILGGAFNDIHAALQGAGQTDLVRQLGSVIIPVQKPGGDCESFSFMAFPYPRLTIEERKNLPFLDEKSHHIKCGSVDIRIDVDQFGQINWLHIANAPNLHQKLTECLQVISDEGGNLAFWKY